VAPFISAFTAPWFDSPEQVDRALLRDANMTVIADSARPQYRWIIIAPQTIEYALETKPATYVPASVFYGTGWIDLSRRGYNMTSISLTDYEWRAIATWKLSQCKQPIAAPLPAQTDAAFRITLRCTDQQVLVLQGTWDQLPAALSTVVRRAVPRQASP
jgi:hypothetical protein